MSNNRSYRNRRRKQVKKEYFSCPLGRDIMWWRGFIYKECPLSSSYRNMSECSDCALRRNSKWNDNKEKDKPRRKRNKE